MGMVPPETTSGMEKVEAVNVNLPLADALAEAEALSENTTARETGAGKLISSNLVYVLTYVLTDVRHLADKTLVTTYTSPA